jgi:gas vesicle protein
MKSIGKRLVVSSLVLIAGISLAARCHASPGTEKIKEDAKATFEKAKDTVHDVVVEVKSTTKEGAHKANEAASTVRVQVKTSVRKANEVTTSVFTTTRQTVLDTNAKIKEKIKSSTR